MTIFEGSLTAPSGRLAVIASRFNQSVVDKLVEGAKNSLRDHGISKEAIDLIWVPGAFEIPLVADRLAKSKRYAAVVCLGAVIRGDTDHYEYVSRAAASGIARAGLESGVPVIFGVLTCNTTEQALERAGGSEGNKGAEAVATALEMVSLLKQLP